MKRDSRIISGSMGCYLSPPNHPNYNYVVETDLRRKKDNRGSMSIEYCASDEVQYEFETKKEAQKLISDWQQSKLPLLAPEVKDWIKHCYDHFGQGIKAIEYIQKYYPEYNALQPL